MGDLHIDCCGPFQYGTSRGEWERWVQYPSKHHREGERVVKKNGMSLELSLSVRYPFLNLRSLGRAEACRTWYLSLWSINLSNFIISVYTTLQLTAHTNPHDLSLVCISAIRDVSAKVLNQAQNMSKTTWFKKHGSRHLECGRDI